MQHELQLDGQQWAKIQNYIAQEVEKVRSELAADITAANAATKAAETERDRLAALLAEASTAFDAGDIATLAKMREEALKTEKEKALEAAIAEKAAAEAKIAELSAEL